MPIWHVSLDTHCLPRATLLTGREAETESGVTFVLLMQL